LDAERLDAERLDAERRRTTAAVNMNVATASIAVYCSQATMFAGVGGPHFLHDPQAI
jgi:hypothetical protein